MSTKGLDGANVLVFADINIEHSIVSSDSSNDEFVVSGDVTDDLDPSPSDGTKTDTFTVSGTTNDDGDKTVSSISYDSGSDQTTITISGSVSDDLSNTGTIDYNVFKEAAVQQDLTVENSRNMIEADHKQKGHKNFIYGKADGSISLEALILNPSATQQVKDALDNARVNENEVVVRRRKNDPNSDTTQTEEAPFLVEQLNKNYPDNDSSTYTAELQQNDFWSEI